VVILWIAIIIVAALLAYAVWIFNKLVGLNKRADASWSDIDVQLKRRWDLVPALVETVKGYARHESTTLERVVEARGRASEPASIPERGAREQSLSSAVGRLFAVAEAYPDLKAAQNFQDLQRNLVDIENNIQYARRYYNAVVRDLNTLIEVIPSAFIAAVAGFRERPYFELEEAQRAAPRIALDSPSPSGAVATDGPPGQPG
jgi:LemA protein